MHHWTDPSQLPADLAGSAVSFGNFDGVHQGHQAVLAQLVDEAGRRELPAIAITFEPHPVAVLRPDIAPEMLTSPAQKLERLAQTGIDGTLVLEFTPELARQTPEEYVRRTLVEALKAKVVVVGEDARFGVRNSGTVSTLRELGLAYGFDVIEVADVGEAGRWSSSRIRELVMAGDVATAARVLGRPHVVRGVVVHGDHRGRGLGFPTANLAHDPGRQEGLVPADGVYAGWFTRHDVPPAHPDHRLPAAISIGTNPTFDGHVRRVEAYVLDRDDLYLYDETVSVEFVALLRPTLRFDSIDALIEQMNDDVTQTRRALGVLFAD